MILGRQGRVAGKGLSEPAAGWWIRKTSPPTTPPPPWVALGPWEGMVTSFNWWYRDVCVWWSLINNYRKGFITVTIVHVGRGRSDGGEGETRTLSTRRIFFFFNVIGCKRKRPLILHSVLNSAELRGSSKKTIFFFYILSFPEKKKNTSSPKLRVTLARWIDSERSRIFHFLFFIFYLSTFERSQKHTFRYRLSWAKLLSEKSSTYRFFSSMSATDAVEIPFALIYATQKLVFFLLCGCIEEKIVFYIPVGIIAFLNGKKIQ